MDIIKKLVPVAAVALLPSTMTYAQPALRSAYFLEGYLYRHQMNPALAGERNYVSFPGLGNLSVGAASNVGVSNFIYKTPGGPTTFMNECVGADDFLGGLHSKNRVNADVGETVLSAGFFALGGYNTVDINVRSSTSVNLPGELFAFMKNGMSGSQTSYDVGDLGVSSTNYAEIALGHSHKINDRLNVGATVKILLGLGQATAWMKDMKVRMSGDEWMIQSRGEFSTSVSGLGIPTKQEVGKEFDPAKGEGDLVSWGDVSYDKFGINGGGLAFDLGATYRVMDGLELSAAITDLGFVRWSSATRGSTADSEWSFRGFDNIALSGDGDNKIGDQVDDLFDDLEDFVNFHRVEGTSGRTTALAATLTIGALYTLPFYQERLKVGFLSTTRIHGAYTWSEGRFSANWMPCKVFDASVNYAISTFGSSFGWVLNVHPKGFNFFVGSDHQFFHITPQFVPVGKATASVSVGINFPFGSTKTL